MKTIGLVFILISMVALLYFGMGTVTEISDGTNITSGDDNYENYNTATNTTTAVFGIANTIPYILVLAALLACLLMMVRILK